MIESTLHFQSFVPFRFVYFLRVVFLCTCSLAPESITCSIVGDIVAI
jgi:hypothetical protein